MIPFLIATTLIAAFSSWGFAMMSVNAYQSGFKRTGLFFAVLSLLLGVGGIAVWLFIR